MCSLANFKIFHPQHLTISHGIDTTITKFYKAGLSVTDINKAKGLSNEQIINAVKDTVAGKK